MTTALHRRVTNLEKAKPAGRVFPHIEGREDENPEKAEARCRREQGIPPDTIPDITVVFFGLA